MKIRVLDSILEVATFCSECHEHIEATVDSIEVGKATVRLNFSCHRGHELNEDMSRDDWERLSEDPAPTGVIC